MRKFAFRIVLGSFLLAWVAPAPGQNRFNLPQIANGNGFRTTFILFNNTMSPVTATLTLRDNDGAPLSMSIPELANGSEFQVSLDPGETRFLQSDGEGDLKVGSGIVTATGPLGVAAVFSFAATEAGVGASPPLREFALAVDSHDNYNTGVALQNLEQEPTTVTFTLYDAEGTQDDNPVVREIPADGHLSVFFSGPGGLFPPKTEFQGRMVVSAASDVAALPLRQELMSGILTTLPAVSTSSHQTSFILPQVANGVGIRTEFILFNLSSAQAVPARLDLTDDAGEPLIVNLSNGVQAGSFELEVPAGGAVFLETDGLGETIPGTARVTADGPIGVSAVFSIFDGQGTVVTEAGVGDSLELQRFTLPVDLTGAFNTGVAFFNNNPSPADIQAAFVDGSGVIQQSDESRIEPFTLGAGEHLSRFVTELAAGLGEARGSLVVTANAPVSALPLRQGTAPLILTTLPVQEGVFSESGDAIRALPKTVAGIDLTSDVVLNQTLTGGFSLSGTVLLPNPISALARVEARNAQGDIFSASTSAQGDYEIFVPPGTYDLLTCYIEARFLPDQDAQAQPAGFFSVNSFGHESADVPVTADTKRDIVVSRPATWTVGGSITNFGSLPDDLKNRIVLLDFSGLETPDGGFAVLDENGEYTISLPDGIYRTALSIRGNSPEAADSEETAALYNLGNVAVLGQDVVSALAAPTLLPLTGTVDQGDSPAFPTGFLVQASDGSSSPETDGCMSLSSSSTDNALLDGQYRVRLIRGRSYDLSVSYWKPLAPVPEGGRINLDLGRINLQTSSFLDVQLPALPEESVLSGRVIDTAGAPLEGVAVSASAHNATAPGDTFTVSTTTDANGEYALTVLRATNYSVRYRPPLSR